MAVEIQLKFFLSYICLQALSTIFVLFWALRIVKADSSSHPPRDEINNETLRRCVHYHTF